jgi:hypothetical protein
MKEIDKMIWRGLFIMWLFILSVKLDRIIDLLKEIAK